MKKYIVMRSLPNLTEGGGHKFAAGAIFISNPTDEKAVIQELETAITKALERTNDKTTID